MYMEEQETNINYNAKDLEANIYTAYPRDISRFKKLVQENPNDVKLVREDEHGITISVPRNWVKVRPPRKMTEEQKIQNALNLQKWREKINS